MPKMDGFAFLAELKRSGLNIPTIVATSDIQEDARQECLDLGALHVIHKPIKKEAILNALSRMLQPCQGKTK
ncbi:MAG: response regulator, partial [Nitrospirota bacterium]|nr:response regulator [Nitrospirota bacterium]